MAKLTEHPPAQTDRWGIDSGYEDALGDWFDSSEETIEAIRQAMGVTGSEPALTGPLFARAGEAKPLDCAATVRLENGDTRRLERALPADLPEGYHEIQFERDQEPVRLIVTPGKCYLPPDLRTWGWAVQLYAARSNRSWGIGDLTDLDRLASWSAADGAGMLLVNPLGAAAPILPQQTSPYFPSSRRFLNPLWIDVEAAPGARAADLTPWAERARELNTSRLIDRDRVWELKKSALNTLWGRFGSDASCERFFEAGGAELERFAIFCTLAEQQNTGWQQWPVEYSHPANREVAKFAAANRQRVDFFKWLQWIADRQLARSSGHLALMQDLPIGVDPNGADAWAWQDVFAVGAAVGGAPDEFNRQGQNWGLPPFIPHKLRAAHYGPFIDTIRCAFRHGGGLRIDHVMGLFRLFWIPEGREAQHGAYVRYNADEMLAILALESRRARGYVVGEDLGTVEDGMQEKLASFDILSYRLLWFEKDDPSEYPANALAAITTHDLPTVAGLWTGVDLARQQELRLNPNEESTAEIYGRVQDLAKADGETPLPDVIARSYEHLARAPSRILAAALEDAAQVKERPNIPATLSNQNPNWMLALPCPIEELTEGELAGRIARGLQRTE